MKYMACPLTHTRSVTLSDDCATTQADSFQSKKPSMGNRRRRGGGESVFKDCKSFCFGLDSTKKNFVGTFPGFKSLHRQKGKVVTSFGVILSTLLLSKFLLGNIGMDPNLSAVELCSSDDSADQMAEMAEELANITNIDYARSVSTRMSSFYDALTNDTALYGVPPHECQTIPGPPPLSGLKSDWSVSTDEPALSNGAFFPGYCAAAKEAAAAAAKARQCVKPKCVCKKIIGICFGGATKHCFNSPVPCPVHSNDVSDAAALNAYRKDQVVRATENIDDFNVTETEVPDTATDSAVNLMETIMFQVDIASIIYVVYSVIALFVAVPLELYRSPLWPR